MSLEILHRNLASNKGIDNNFDELITSKITFISKGKCFFGQFVR